MLPANKRKNGEKDKYTTEKDDFRISIESINSASSGSLFKIRHRKKNGVAAALKLYCWAFALLLAIFFIYYRNKFKIDDWLNDNSLTIFWPNFIVFL